jgi:hypothetical protein
MTGTKEEFLKRSRPFLYKICQNSAADLSGRYTVLFNFLFGPLVLRGRTIGQLATLHKYIRFLSAVAVNDWQITDPCSADTKAFVCFPLR